MAGISLIDAALIFALLAFAAALRAALRKGKGQYRPLAQRQPEQGQETAPLGMEAIDLKIVTQTQRRNEALERSQTSFTRAQGFFVPGTRAADTDLTALPADETYAARYHAAFRPDKKDQTR